MLIPRSTFLTVAGVELGAFKPLLSRGQVPVFPPTNDGQDRDTRGYFGIEAFMLAMAEVIAKHSGLNRDDVCRVVENHTNIPLEIAWGNIDQPDFLMLIHTDSPELYAGPREELWEVLRGEAPTIGEDMIKAIVFIPFADIARGVMDRAKAAGVTIALRADA